MDIAAQSHRIQFALCASIEAHLETYVSLTSKKRYPVRQVESTGKVIRETLMSAGDILGKVDSSRYPLLAEMQAERVRSEESWENLVCRFFLTYRWGQS